MSSLRRLPINYRLWLILVSSIIMLLALTALMLKQTYGDLYAAKALKTREVVETASGILRHFQALESAGNLSRTEAQQQAMQLVRGLRYDEDDYFWINDLTADDHAPGQPQTRRTESGGYERPGRQVPVQRHGCHRKTPGCRTG